MANLQTIKTDLTADREVVDMMISQATEYARDNQVIDAAIILVDRTGTSFIAVSDRPTKSMIAELEMAKDRIIRTFDE